MRNLIIASVILLFSVFSYAAPCDSHVFNQQFPLAQKDVTRLCKTRFAVGYDMLAGTPVWASYKITPENMRRAGLDRSSTFRPDPAIRPNKQPNNAQFVGNNLDRGHLVPFEDVNDDKTAALESMLFSNIVPQYDSFNRGIWKALEGRIRHEGLINELYVITGPIYQSGISSSGSLLVPTAFFKVIINIRTKRIVSYLIPHSDTAKTVDLNKYVVRLSAIEKSAGLIILLDKLSLTETKKGL